MQTLKFEERAVFALRQLYSGFGYRPYKLSRFEDYELYLRNKDFLGDQRIITFSGSDGRLLAMKPDVTLSILKNAPQEPGVVRKVYYNENVYRDQREIQQTGLECMGDLGDYEIAEVTVLAARSLAMLGKPFVLELSHVGLVEAILAPLSPQERTAALQALRRKSPHELQEAAGGQWEKLKALLECGQTLSGLEAVLTEQAERDALEELTGLAQALEQAGFAEQLRVDFSVSSSLKYYSGVVFKGYLQGIPRAVLSGGAYSRLARKLGRSSKAIGFAIYLDLLAEEAEEQPVDVLLLHDGSLSAAELLAQAQRYAAGGSVLVARQEPADGLYRRVIRLGRDTQ